MREQQKQIAENRPYLVEAIDRITQVTKEPAKRRQSTTAAIRKTLGMTRGRTKADLHNLLSSIQLGETDKKVALHSFDHAGPCSRQLPRLDEFRTYCYENEVPEIPVLLRSVM